MNDGGRVSRVLLIVPPFAALDRPALGVHTLQARLRGSGIECDVLYSNALYAKQIGFALYQKLAYSVPVHMLGERLFAAALEAERHPGIVPGQAERLRAMFASGPQRETMNGECIDSGEIECALDGLEAYRSSLCEHLATTSAELVGLTSSYQQICSSEWHMLLMRRIRPASILAVGGANCHGVMARGVRDFSRYLDLVFAGESDLSMTRYCLGELQPADGIVHGAPVMDLNAGQSLDFSAYYTQMCAVDYPDLQQAWLTYETSRGCWWGVRSHCTFCGLNPQAMSYRCKDPDLALRELKVLHAQHPSPNIFIVDNILPHHYMKTFLPRLQQHIPGCRVFYETKANLKPRELDTIKAAGIVSFQPGIEALSSPLLKLMRKGVSGRANLRLLIESKRRDLRPQWNLLYGFPGEQLDWYESVIENLPRLHHLPPPSGATRVSLDRFSPLFEQHRSFGIDSVAPCAGYREIFGDPGLAKDIAYYHEGDFSTELLADATILRQFRRRVSMWVDAWTRRTPVLKFYRLNDQLCLVVDTRAGETGLDWVSLSLARRCFALDGLPAPGGDVDDELALALKRGYLLAWEGVLVNLVEELVQGDHADETKSKNQPEEMSAGGQDAVP